MNVHNYIYIRKEHLASFSQNLASILCVCVCVCVCMCVCAAILHYYQGVLQMGQKT